MHARERSAGTCHGQTDRQTDKSKSITIETLCDSWRFFGWYQGGIGRRNGAAVVEHDGMLLLLPPELKTRNR
jgi:hypothetical protein